MEPRVTALRSIFSVIDGTAEVVPDIRRPVEAFRTTDSPIVHVVRLYRGDGSNVDQCRRADIGDGAAFVRPGTEGAELVEELRPSPDVRLDAERLLDGQFQRIGPDEQVLYKPRWSAFYRTDLAEFLETRGVDTVVVCGCNFPNCPRTTIYEASERDYRIVLVSDATSGVYERGVQELGNIRVSIKRTADTLDWLTA